MEIQASTPDRFTRLCKAIWKVNLCTGFPLSDSMIEAWATHLLRMYPDVDVDALDRDMDKLVKREIVYVMNHALYNIINLLPKEVKEPKKTRLKPSDFWSEHEYNEYLKGLKNE